MIEKYSENPVILDKIMNLWLNTNISAHPFVPETHWRNNYNYVKDALPTADVYIYDVDKGFIGIADNNYIAGLFIDEKYQSQGIGKKLLQYCKLIYPSLTLHVYKNNQKAVSFYLKNNFNIKNEKKDKDTGFLEYEMYWSK